MNGHGACRATYLGLVTQYLWCGRKLCPTDFKISSVEYITLLDGEECEEMGLITFHGSIEKDNKRIQPLPKNDLLSLMKYFAH